MRNLKNPQFIIPLIILIITIGWLGYQKIGKQQPKAEVSSPEEHKLSQEELPINTAKCGIENCHGLSVSCGSNLPESCTEIYQLGDFCRNYVSCEIVGKQCQLVEKPEFKQCKSCVKGCKQLKDQNVFDCENECRKALINKAPEKLKTDENNNDNDGNIYQPKEKTDKQTRVEVDTSNWNSFTHKAYNYTVKFPNNWYWDGTDVNILLISAEAIRSSDQALTANNLKIIKADQEVVETGINTVSLGGKFKAVYLRNHNYKDIIDQIIKSFKI